jgi:hypothetical protein
MTQPRWYCGFALGIALLAVPSTAGAEEAGKELRAALKKTTPGLEAYSFRVEPGPGGGAAVTGKFKKGQPLFCQADGIEFFRKGDVMIYRQGERWMRTKRGRESDPLRILGASAAVNRVRPPHQELPALVKDLGDVKKSDKKGGVVYTGTLDEAAARKLSPPEVRDITRGGEAEVWTEDGAIVKYRYTLRVQGRLGNADVDGTRTKTVNLSGLSTTKVEVPEAARKALE